MRKPGDCGSLRECLSLHVPVGSFVQLRGKATRWQHSSGLGIKIVQAIPLPLYVTICSHPVSDIQQRNDFYPYSSAILAIEQCSVTAIRGGEEAIFNNTYQARGICSLLDSHYSSPLAMLLGQDGGWNLTTSGLPQLPHPYCRAFNSFCLGF